MLKVGVTGGIGSGKSLACQIIKSIGYPVYNADLRAKILTDTNPIIIDGLKNLFGEDIYINGNLNRKSLADRVFQDPNLLNKVNSLIHPIVAHDFDSWVLDNSSNKILFKEAAILFESGAYKQVDKVIAVWAPIELRIKRVCERDGVSAQDVEKRIKNQINEAELLSRSDFIIKNNEFELLTPQVVNVVDAILKLL